jgi:hypothetical protein
MVRQERPLALLSPVAMGSRPATRTSRAMQHREAGRWLTGIGLANLVLMGIFGATYPSLHNSDAGFLVPTVGMGLSGVIGGVLLSVGIPFWADGQSQLDHSLR